MARKFSVSLILCGVLLMSAHAASAKDGLFGMGARFAWENYKTPILDQMGSDGAPIDLGVDLSSLNKTNFGGDFQLRPIDRLSISLALDMGFAKHSMTLPDATVANASTFSFGFLLGVKFYIMEPAPGKASLYLQLAGGKYIGKVKNNASSLSAALDSQLKALSKLSSPLVIQFALGAEFFASKAFSVGADVLGFRMAYSKSKQYAEPVPIWGEPHKLLTFTIYSALTLNFGFYKGDGSTSSRSKKDEDFGSSEDDGWGASSSGSGAAASGGDGWDGGGSSAASSSDSGWGSSSSGSTAASSDGWGATPPPPPPSDSDAGGGWEAQPPPPDDESPVKSNKGKAAKPKASGGGGGGSAPPPPPPPGY